MSEVAKELANKRPTFKIIVVGDSGVGKTCLVTIL
jgi:GTPase SAR1 family protein